MHACVRAARIALLDDDDDSDDDASAANTNSPATLCSGQAWALYGFTSTYESTKTKLYLTTAQRAADLFLKRLSSDMVPLWDFDAPKSQVPVVACLWWWWRTLIWSCGCGAGSVLGVRVESAQGSANQPVAAKRHSCHRLQARRTKQAGLYVQAAMWITAIHYRCSVLPALHPLRSVCSPFLLCPRPTTDPAPYSQPPGHMARPCSPGKTRQRVPWLLPGCCAWPRLRPALQASGIVAAH